ncbi:MAG: helix-turn-helix transcriptional regulator, partial [Lachnospiraceae bacterium]|nr:helix-turn-helix transcriptional regulator [Lachnospiraceae bacterium]
EKSNLTQTDILAKLQLKGVEISVYSLSKIENGRQNPTVSLLSALTEILDCDYNSFFNS